MEFIYEKQILEHHLDTFGHVNNATYLALYEEARWDMTVCRGMTLETILERQKGPVVLEAKVRYKKEIKNREHIKIITTHNVKRGQKLMRVEQRMEKSDGSVASTAEFLVGYMDLKERKLITPDEAWYQAIGMGDAE